MKINVLEYKVEYLPPNYGGLKAVAWVWFKKKKMHTLNM